MSPVLDQTREGSEYTQYADFTIEYRDASHRYWLCRGSERTPVTSVTSALKVLDKPALIGWAERMGVEGALRLERAGALQAYTVEDAIYAVRDAKEGADAKRDAGGDRGNALHEAQRLYCELGSVPKVGDFDPEHRGYVSAYCKWLLRDKPEPILVEKVVGSMRHLYAGRIDLLAKINGRTILPDLKTSGRTYPEQHLQVAGYLGAVSECEPELIVDGGMIVLLSGDGTFKTYPCRADHKHFLAVLACQRAFNAVRDALRAEEKANAQ